MTSEVEASFVGKLRLTNGTSRTTYRHRLDDVNERLLRLLPEKRCLDVMDVGISWGYSTLEWSDHLHQNGFQHQLVAGDILTEAWRMSLGNRLAVLFAGGSDEPLRLEVGSVMLPVHSDRWLARAARPLLVPFLRAIAAVGRRAERASSVDSAKPGRWITRSVPLVSPELRRRAEIQVVQDDITTPDRFPMAFDVIRVANLVQRVYFDEGTLRKIVINLRDRLRDGGLLVICRTTEDGVNHASIFRRTTGHLTHETSLNGGAEVRDLVLAVDASGTQ